MSSNAVRFKIKLLLSVTVCLLSRLPDIQNVSLWLWQQKKVIVDGLYCHFPNSFFFWKKGEIYSILYEWCRFSAFLFKKKRVYFQYINDTRHPLPSSVVNKKYYYSTAHFLYTQKNYTICEFIFDTFFPGNCSWHL